MSAARLCQWPICFDRIGERPGSSGGCSASCLPRSKRMRSAPIAFFRQIRRPGLQFKKLEGDDGIDSAWIDLDYRALAVMRKHRVVWYWIGNHTDYDRLVKQPGRIAACCPLAPAPCASTVRLNRPDPRGLPPGGSTSAQRTHSAGASKRKSKSHRRWECKQGECGPETRGQEVPVQYDAGCAEDREQDEQIPQHRNPFPVISPKQHETCSGNR